MTTGIRHDDLRRRNRALVVGAVRRAGQPSRTELAARTGLSNSTISTIAADLIAEGILTEVKGGEGAGRRGRPQVALSVDPAGATVIGVMLTLDRLSATLFDYAGGIVAEVKTQLATAAMSRDELEQAVLQAVRQLLARHKGTRPARIVLAVQGITDSAATTMLWSPITPHQDIAFGPVLEAAFGMPATVQNDCNMIAVALRWRAPERYRDDFFAILLSNGIGMGIMLKGQLFTGTHSSGAEFGHMMHIPHGALCRCGRHGCVEAYAGNYAVMRNALGQDERSEPAADIDEAALRRLADAARAGDGPERAAFVKAGEALGFAMGSLFALFDPAPVAIVGRGALAFDIIEEPIRQAIARTAGGQHSGAISFEALPDEMPLIREGCAMHALAAVDAEIAASERSARGASFQPTSRVNAG